MNLRNADLYSQDEFHYAQVIWLLIGAIVAVLVAKLDFIVFERLAWGVYVLSVIGLIAVLFFAKEINHSRRWISLFGLNIQPSELAKLGVILLLSRYFHRSRQTERYGLKTLWKPAGIIALPAALVLVEPDLGSSIALVLIGMSIVFFAGVRLKSVLILAGLIAMAIPLAWQTDVILPYQKDRVALWLNPEQFQWDKESRKRLDKNLQPQQALWAVGSGRLFGRGGEGTRRRLHSLPEMQTDFVIAPFSVDNGFAGCFLLVILYYLLSVWGLSVARDARDRFSALVSVGAVSLVFWQRFMNIGMVTGVLPVVGITLPMMSYGGSALVTTFFSWGLLFNAALHMRRRP